MKTKSKDNFIDVTVSLGGAIGSIIAFVSVVTSSILPKVGGLFRAWEKPQVRLSLNENSWTCVVNMMLLVQITLSPRSENGEAINRKQYEERFLLQLEQGAYLPQYT